MNIKTALLLLILSLPSFSLMLRPGIYTTHDFHVFRQSEFNNCLNAGIFPCSWSKNSSKGFGSPMFIYYAQLSYLPGFVLGKLGLDILDAVKGSFILSLVLSGYTFYLFGRKMISSTAGLMFGTTMYIYAPYRSVDVWVRGALPESWSFVVIPIVLLGFIEILEKKETNLKSVATFTLSLSLLVLIHNLSALMMGIFLLTVWLFYSFINRKLIKIKTLFLCGILTLGISSWYVFPIVFDKNLITIESTTQDFYQYGSHFTTLYRLFISQYWGYGASVWGPNQYMSFSIGYLHWIIPLFLVILIPFIKNKKYIYYSLLGLLASFLTHGKSKFIWDSIPAMPYIQFPWRFLIFTSFFFSVASSFVGEIKKNIKFTVPTLFVLLLLVYAHVFRPDIWRDISEREFFSGINWNEQRSASLSDFWPKTAGQLPQDFAKEDSEIYWMNPHKFSFKIDSYNYSTLRVIPIIYFPGWRAFDNSKNPVNISIKDGLMAIESTNDGKNIVNFEYYGTSSRTVGLFISIFTILIFSCIPLIKKN